MTESRPSGEIAQMATAIVLGLSPTGLYVVRELGKAGIRTIGITDTYASTLQSRFLSEYLLVKNDDLLLQRLIEVAGDTLTPPILIPTADRYIEFIAQNHSTLKSHFVYQQSYNHANYSDYLDKLMFHSLCMRHDMATPDTAKIENSDQLSELKPGYPFILKPALIHHVKHLLRGKKLLIVSNDNELARAANIIDQSQCDWVCQEIVPGPESNIWLCAVYVDKSGIPHDAVTARKLRQHPPQFGSASLVTTEENEEVLSLSIDFLKKTQYQGIVGLEFKYDEIQKQYKMIEVNQRATLWFNITHDYGRRLALRLYADLTQTPTDLHCADDGSSQYLWRYTIKDIWSSWYYLLNRRPLIDKPVMPPLPAHKRSWAIYDRADPLPAFTELLIQSWKLLTGWLNAGHH
jgi:D-aspartate ligase